ncbi:hypothetical protein LCGC14_2680480 [marine sediment metagenome]|uniref:Uncharacterized protein n=1 Tax=marine sediment metagenome TaxID=412755 RepID=A0A0F9BW87_9ZZZZ
MTVNLTVIAFSFGSSRKNGVVTKVAPTGRTIYSVYHQLMEFRQAVSLYLADPFAGQSEYFADFF